MIRRFVGWVIVGVAGVFAAGMSHSIEVGAIVVGVLLLLIIIFALIRKLFGNKNKQGW
jgi:hypothetical protein